MEIIVVHIDGAVLRIKGNCGSQVFHMIPGTWQMLLRWQLSCYTHH